MPRLSLLLLALTCLCACHPDPPQYDLIIRNGVLYDGSGKPGFRGDLAIQGDSIAALGDLGNAKGKVEVDAGGKAVAPGFVNVLSWSTTSLLADGRSQSDIRQGVTLELMGEGWSMGPLNDFMKDYDLKNQGDIKYDITWTTLSEYLEHLEKKGVSCNVASFLGAATTRIHELRFENRAPTPDEMERMRGLVRQAMEEGAFGIGSALIYAPDSYAKTEELIELCKVAAPYGGSYITHMRSEGNRFLEAIDEVIRIAKEAGIHAEIYHLKAGGKPNWHKMDQAIAKIDSARAAGINITTNMYTYVAGATGFDASMPPAVQEGGIDRWVERLKDLKQRPAIIAAMKANATDWENLYYFAGADGVKLLGFKEDSLKYLTGKTLAEAAKLYGTSPEQTIIDLIIKDHTRIEAAYFLMSEDNVRKQIKLPYMSFGSDAESSAPEGVFLKSSTHPRAYGNFARLLGKYVRDEKVIPMEDAIRKLTLLPCENFGIKRRGKLAPGYHADVVVFDPEKIQDHATFEKPQQYATGVTDVWVNGMQVLKNGEHTGATPGRVVRGPGYKAKH
ncbi:MAG: D-aminoacylase [Saprospiraceae bacterium]|nr:D-aminoacylase [Saprospiraceae bacterium]